LVPVYSTRLIKAEARYDIFYVEGTDGSTWFVSTSLDLWYRVYICTKVKSVSGGSCGIRRLLAIAEPLSIPR
jgi:hypothetical protein